MPVDLIAEADLRAALLPCRVDAKAFEAGVRSRLEVAVEQMVSKQPGDESLARLSPWLRSAAAFLPLEVLAGCQGTAAAAKLAPVTGGYKLLSYLAFPAISLFVLLGAAISSILRIRSIQYQSIPGRTAQETFQTAMRMSWLRTLGALAVFTATLFLSWIGATWLVFVVYIVSFGLLVQVLTALAKHGLGNRQVISQFCAQGLLFLSIASGSVGRGEQEVRFIDPQVIWAVFMAGVWILTSISLATLFSMISDSRIATGRQPSLTLRLAVWGVPLLVLLIPLLLLVQTPLSVRIMNPVLWPATPAQIEEHVESFATAPYRSATWHNWEIVAQWAIDSNLNPDLSQPRQLLAEEISGGQNPYILGSALRVGLLQANQTGELRDYSSRRHLLLAAPPRGKAPQAILSLDQQDWVIRVAMLRGDLSPAERDDLEKRLLATLERMSEDKHVTLKTALRVTQLLDVIERPLERDQYREKMHEWLRTFHSPIGRRFQPGGGFKTFLSISSGSLDATAHAVELMEIFGPPGDLDLNSVRSFLRPQALQKITDQRYVASAALHRLDRLSHLPVGMRPTWLEVLYHERTLLAAVILVGLCLYATFSSPMPTAITSVPATSSSGKHKPATGQAS